MRATSFFVIAIVLRAAPSAADSLCRGDEQPIFSCAAKEGGKYASVCLASRALSLRFGKPGQIELEIPAAPTELQREARKRPGRIGNALVFSRDDLTYRVDDDEDAKHPGDSAARVEVWRRGGGRAKDVELETLGCAPGWKQQWHLLDGIVPIAHNTPDPLPAAGGTHRRSRELACLTAAPLTGLRRQIAEQFRAFAEKRQPFYALALSQFGAPESCAITEEDVPRQPDRPGQPTPIDATNFAGTLVYSFHGATLTLSSRYQLDAQLAVPDGFQDPSAARAAAQSAARLSTQAAHSKITVDEVAGTRTETLSSDAEGSQTAELTTRGDKLIAIRAR